MSILLISNALELRQQMSSNIEQWNPMVLGRHAQQLKGWKYTYCALLLDRGCVGQALLIFSAVTPCDPVILEINGRWIKFS